MTTPSFRLPASGNGLPAPGSSSDPINVAGVLPEAGGDTINILIVDDEPANLVVLETVLDDPGYRLVRALSADQALMALVEQEFALLILDVRMPGMTGFELAQMVKERKKTARVPIIFLTAYYDKDQHILEGYGTGAVDYLNKPVNPAVLRSKVSVFADLHRSSRALTLSNRALVAEVGERRRAEEQLRELNDTLERRVTERTEALRRSDHKLQVIMSSITDGLLMLDRNWCFTYFNEQGARMVGMRLEQLLGACVWDLFPHARGTKFYEGFQRAVQTQQTVLFEEFYPHPINVWIECHCYPSDDGLSVYFHDITDRREVEERRDRLLRAEQAARTEGERIALVKDDFLATLSHELRTPLAAIVGWASILKRADIDAETQHRGIDAIARNAQVQASLIADLLDMNRIVSGKLRLNIERIDLNLIAAAAADTVRPAALAKGVGIDVQLAGISHAEVMGDSARLHQIAWNLITNAVKFTNTGGTVAILIEVNDLQVCLTITDTGQGISPEFLPYLFDRFSQSDGTAARLHGGLGLGLSIVRNLVELHAGSVSASSAGQGQGSSFKVQLPKAGRTPVQTAFRHDQADREPADDFAVSGRQMLEGQIDLNGVSVLLVDDHADMLEVERRLLSECGATVTTAESAGQALQLLRSGRFDVLLSDLGMPGMDGYALIREVRTTLGLAPAQLPAAAVTAFVRAEDREQAVLAGYQACIQKPVSPTLLVGTVYDLWKNLRVDGAAAGAGNSGQWQANAPEGGPAADSRLGVLFVEDHTDLREQIGWLLEEEGLDVVACASGEEAEIEFQKRPFDVVLTDVSLPQMTGVELARRLLAQAPQTWIIFSTGYPMGDRLAEFGPHVRALLKPFEASELHRLMDEVRADRLVKSV